MQFIYAQLLFAQGNIAVQQGKAFVDGFNQRIIYRKRNIVVGKRHFHRRAVLSCLCEKDIAFYRCGIGCGDGVFLCGIDRIEIFERLLTNRAVGAFQKGDISALCQLQFFSCGSADRRESDIRVIQHGKNLLWCAAQLCGSGKQMLLRWGKGVCLLAQKGMKEMVIDSEIRCFFCTEDSKFFLRNGNNFRGEEGNCRRIANQQQLCTGSQPLIEGICTILVHPHGGVGIDMV